MTRRGEGRRSHERSLRALSLRAVGRVLLLVAGSVALGGCGTVRLEVPPGHEVRLLQEDEPAEIRVERTVWYWQFGGAPISDNSCKQEIEEYGLKEVRVTTDQGLVDNLFNTVGWIVTIVRRTLVVEGNR